MRYYCHLATDGVDSTNLQLYSLQQAAQCWNELAQYRASYSSTEDIPHYRERLAFILSCFGLSLTQLLGQNVASGGKKKMAHVGDLLAELLVQASVDRATKSKINKAFQEFLPFYNAVRHLGDSGNGEKYRKLDELTISHLDRFRQMTLQIWDTAIAMYQKDSENDIHVETISEAVFFEELDVKTSG
jgi:hypothetical protein